MAQHNTHHQYGNSRIAGRANVQQGDRHVTNHIHIATAYLSLQDELDLPRLDRSRLPARLFENHWLYQERNDTPASARDVEGCDSVEDYYNLKGRPYSRQSNDSDLPAVEHGSVCSKHLTSSDQERCDSAIPALSVKEQSRHKLLFSLLEQLHGILMKTVFPHMKLQASLRISGEHCSTDCSEMQGRASLASSELAVNHQHPRGAGQDLLMLCIGVMACLVGRNVSRADVAQVINRCQQDQLLPVLAALLGFGFARYLYFGQLPPQLSMGDHIYLEDAYGRQRTVPAPVYGDWSILKTFLAVHYRETQSILALGCTNANDYNLTLGSRRGRVVHPPEWTQARVKPGTKVIVSVYVDTEYATCLICKRSLTVTVMGEFHCNSCMVFHRDYDNLKPAEKAGPEFDDRYAKAGPTGSDGAESTSPFSNTSRVQLGESQERGTNGYTLEGLKHIDLRIVPGENRRAFHQPLQPQSGSTRQHESSLRGLHTSNGFLILVEDLSNEVNNEMLLQAFSAFGSVTEARVTWDTETDRSRGYGFVAFKERSDAEKALSGMDREWLGGRAIRCCPYQHYNMPPSKKSKKIIPQPPKPNIGKENCSPSNSKSVPTAEASQRPHAHDEKVVQARTDEDPQYVWSVPASHLAYRNSDKDAAFQLWEQSSFLEMDQEPLRVALLGRTFAHIVAEEGKAPEDQAREPPVSTILDAPAPIDIAGYCGSSAPSPEPSPPASPEGRSPSSSSFLGEQHGVPELQTLQDGLEQGLFSDAEDAEYARSYLEGPDHPWLGKAKCNDPKKAAATIDGWTPPALPPLTIRGANANSTSSTSSSTVRSSNQGLQGLQSVRMDNNNKTGVAYADAPRRKKGPGASSSVAMKRTGLSRAYAIYSSGLRNASVPRFTT